MSSRHFRRFCVRPVLWQAILLFMVGSEELGEMFPGLRQRGSKGSLNLIGVGARRMVNYFALQHRLMLVWLF